MLTLRPYIRCTTPVTTSCSFAEVLVKQNFTLFLTDLLKNDVFGILGCNTAELFGFDFSGTISPSSYWGSAARFASERAISMIRILYQINNGFLCNDFEITSLGVDAYLYIVCFAKMVFTGLDQRLLNCLKQGSFADILLFLQELQGASINSVFIFLFFASCICVCLEIKC